MAVAHHLHSATRRRPSANRRPGSAAHRRFRNRGPSGYQPPGAMPAAYGAAPYGSAPGYQPYGVGGSTYPKSAVAGWALGLSIAGLVLSCCGGILLSIPGTIMGWTQMKAVDRGERDPASRGTAKAAFIVGIVGIALFASLIGFWVIGVAVERDLTRPWRSDGGRRRGRGHRPPRRTRALRRRRPHHRANTVIPEDSTPARSVSLGAPTVSKTHALVGRASGDRRGGRSSGSRRSDVAAAGVFYAPQHQPP